jgi:hypothetical protein
MSSTDDATSSTAPTPPTQQELKQYLDRVARLGLRVTISVMQYTSHHRVLRAVARGENVQELVEYTVGEYRMQWRVLADESRRYAWITDAADEPRRSLQHLRTIELARYYDPEHTRDVLDPDTTYQLLVARYVAQRRPDACERARRETCQYLVALQRRVSSKAAVTSGSWVWLDAPSWSELFVTSSEGLEMEGETRFPMLVRAFVEGFDPLELGGRDGMLFSSEQSSWCVPDPDDAQESFRAAHYAMVSLRGAYARFAGVPPE